MQPCVYILTNKIKSGSLYIGVTSDISRRLFEHQQELIEGYSKDYNTKRLVYLEHHDHITDAIAREKAMKQWLRRWKVELIERSNPDWQDLTDQIHLS